MDPFYFARDFFSTKFGVDVERAFRILDGVRVSIPCWQGDGVRGFWRRNTALNSGGMISSGKYPYWARNKDQMLDDLLLVKKLIPGPIGIDVHAIYLENGDEIDLDHIEPRNYKFWVEFARDMKASLNFNPTCFNHRLADDGRTVTHLDKSVRDFWISHGIRSREIGEYFGKETGNTCVVNFWFIDGSKHDQIDWMTIYELFTDSLNQIFASETNCANNVDALEPKLWAPGGFELTFGCHEYYKGYLEGKRKIMITLDSGHFPLGESIATMIAPNLCFGRGILLHITRALRWDSDHVVSSDDPDTLRIMRQVVRCNALDKVRLATDYFDGSINQVLAWALGTRGVEKNILRALTEPFETLKQYEVVGDHSSVFALQQAIEDAPFNAIWEEYLRRAGVPTGLEMLAMVREYERLNMSTRQ